MLMLSPVNCRHASMSPEKYEADPVELSAGQQQRVAIVRDLAMKPALMLFGKPTFSLDREVFGEVLAVKRRSRTERGMTMIAGTH